jgi:hypothetical protein
MPEPTKRDSSSSLITPRLDSTRTEPIGVVVTRTAANALVCVALRCVALLPFFFFRCMPYFMPLMGLSLAWTVVNRFAVGGCCQNKRLSILIHSILLFLEVAFLSFRLFITV